METPKKPNDTTKASQTSMGLSLRPSNPDDYPISYADDSWDATEQNSKLSEILEGWGQYDQHTINEALAGRLLAMYAELDERIKRLEGFHYMITGTALQGTIVIEYNGEQIAAVVGADNTFEIKYKEPIQTLEFEGADIVSVSFYDCDSLIGLTSCDDMFKNCVELVAVDFANKSFASVLSAVDMFDGCTALTTLICPETGNWKPNLDFSDCPDLTAQSLEDLIVNFLYTYTSGVHTIKPNGTMWGSLTPAVQNSLESLANAKGWQIDITRYTLSGTSGGNSVTFTINGTSVTVPVTSGVWNYQYNVPITSISFANDTDVVDIDFSLSDGLAGVTSLNEAFKGCVGLTTVDFTNCDLSNVASATDAFLNCSALYSLEIPTGTWEPDLNLASSVMPKTEMLNVIDGLYTYSSGTHTVTFNSTMWDAMSVADQQIVFNAADAKGWTTNAVMVIYVIRGTSTNVNGTETFNIQFILDGQLSPETAETITCAVDSSGNWKYEYYGKKVYSLQSFAFQNTTLLTIDLSASDGFQRVTDTRAMLRACTNLVSADFTNVQFDNLDLARGMFLGDVSLNSINFSNFDIKGPVDFGSLGEGAFEGCTALTTIDLSSATFANAINARRMFYGCTSLTAIDLSGATFANVTSMDSAFMGCTALKTIDLSNATFNELTTFAGYQTSAFYNLANLEQVIFNPSVTFAKVTSCQCLFQGCEKLHTINLGSATFASATLIGGNATASGMFQDCKALTTLDLHSAIFGEVQYANGFLQGCINLQSLDMSNATFAKMVRTTNAFYNANALTTIDVPQNSTAILRTSTAANAPMDLRYSALSYQSMLKVANWLSDLSGYSAHTCTFKATAWNALSSAEQATIDGILSGKNWNRAIA